MNNISIGQYYPSDSVIHRLDPRTKIGIVFLYILSLFFIDKYYPYVFAFIFLAAVIYISKIPVSIVLKMVKQLRFILILTFLINIFFIPGETVFELGFLKISDQGLETAIKMALRLILLVSGTSLLTLTTSPIDLTDGIEALLNPLKVIKVPAHEIAMMMTIALRFIPTLVEETDKIIKAQKARGADFESGNIVNRAKNLVPLLVPLFVSAFRRADELAIAMEARCYRGGDNRTKYKLLEFGKIDRAAAIISVVFFAIIIAIRYI